MSGLGIAPNPRTQTAFQLPSDTSSSASASPQLPQPRTFSDPPSDDEDDVPLPFPTALSRHDFLAPDFVPANYLSSLFPGDADTTRHQTLEDLRTELRERSSAISAELLELVNANYTAFLGLGDTLKGGEERVEDVRVALLGFRRQVEEVQGRVRGRGADVRAVGGELRAVRGEVETGRRMLELDERVEVLLASLEQENDEEEDSEEDGDVVFAGGSPALLTERAREYVAIDRLADALGRDLPYVKKMEEKIARCRNTLLLDLGASIKEARKAGEEGMGRVMGLLSIYRLLGAHADGVRALKEK
ncbi:hypothetical protein N0V93_006306 [Gnomoniopsis smithogilvyi]|uniref:Conserved oligomeric Golgi complex subunit 2 n=1 Tax=Gnomoniopsis smithogilvyi TaxID=1191159 RepID=A0A9W8YRN5_9PEZI|nr:hypothetical protein N0V93_006306 [Gnomoniopsis smithogilvyi]